MCFPRISETLTQCFTAAPQSRHKRLFINAIYQSRSCYHYSELAATVWTLPSSPTPPPKENPPTMSGHARFGMPVKSRATLQALYESVRPRPPPPTPPPTPPARQGCQLPSNQRKGAEEKLSSLTTQDGAVSLTPLPTGPRFQPIYGSVQGQRGPFADWQLYSDGALDFDIRRSGEACFTGPCVHVYYLQSPPGAKVEMILAVSRISAEGGKTKQQRWWGILIFLFTRNRGGHGPLRVGSHSSHQRLLVFTALPRPRCAQCEVSQSPASRNPTTLSLALGKRIRGSAPDGTAHATHMAILIDDCWTEGGRAKE